MKVSSSGRIRCARPQSVATAAGQCATLLLDVACRLPSHRGRHSPRRTATAMDKPKSNSAGVISTRLGLGSIPGRPSPARRLGVRCLERRVAARPSRMGARPPYARFGVDSRSASASRSPRSRGDSESGREPVRRAMMTPCLRRVTREPHVEARRSKVNLLGYFRDCHPQPPGGGRSAAGVLAEGTDPADGLEQLRRLGHQRGGG